MTLQEQIKEFEDKWLVTTVFVTEEQTKSWNIRRDTNAYFYVEGDELPILFADFKSKNTLINNSRSYYQKDFIEEFRLLAKRVRKEKVDDIDRKIK